MKKINKTLAIAALAVASTFAAQSAKAQETFSTDFGSAMEVETQPEAEADFSISSFDDEAYMNGEVVDRGYTEIMNKIKPTIIDLLKKNPNITTESIINTLKNVWVGVKFSGIVIAGIYIFVNGVRNFFKPAFS